MSAPYWKILASPLLVALFVLSKYTPRDDDIWVFGAADGEQFADNSKYAYLYASNETDVRAVWLTKSAAVEADLRDAGYEAYHMGSLRGKLLALRAGYAVVSHGVSDVGSWYLRGATVVQLWHGNALKQIGNDQNPNRTLTNRVYYDLIDNWDYLVVTSRDEPFRVFSRAYDFPEENVLPTGYPRTDALFGPVEGSMVRQDEALHERLRSISEAEQLVAYIPTWRGREFGPSSNPFDPDNFDPDAFEEFLAERDAHLVVKPHPRTELPEDVRSKPRVHVLPKDFDLYPFLPLVDVLVTDYSSIYFDYLCLDRPIVFYPFDLDAYEEKRGLYYEYGEVTPGPTVEKFDDLLDALDDVLSGVDEYAEERNRVTNRFYDACDGRSAERLFRALGATDGGATRSEDVGANRPTAVDMDRPTEDDADRSTAADDGTTAPEPHSSAELPFVSVVVPVYNDPDGVETTLRSLVSQDYPDDRYEIIAVDNDSTDDTNERISRFAEEYSNVACRVEREEHSAGAARNRGVEASRGELLAFLDADMHVDDDWLRSAVRAMPEDVDYMAYDVELYLPEGGETLAGRYNALTGFPMERYVTQEHFGGGGCLFVRRSVFEDLGGFDSRLVSDEDLEFGNRVYESGRELYFAPDVVAYHPARTSLRALVRKNVRVGRGVCQRQRYYPERYGRPGIPPIPQGDGAVSKDLSRLERLQFGVVSKLLLCSRGYGYASELVRTWRRS